MKVLQGIMITDKMSQLFYQQMMYQIWIRCDEVVNTATMLLIFNTATALSTTTCQASWTYVNYLEGPESIGKQSMALLETLSWLSPHWSVKQQVHFIFQMQGTLGYINGSGMGAMTLTPSMLVHLYVLSCTRFSFWSIEKDAETFTAFQWPSCFSTASEAMSDLEKGGGVQHSEHQYLMIYASLLFFQAMICPRMKTMQLEWEKNGFLLLFRILKSKIWRSNTPSYYSHKVLVILFKIFSDIDLSYNHLRSFLSLLPNVIATAEKHNVVCQVATTMEQTIFRIDVPASVHEHVWKEIVQSVVEMLKWSSTCDDIISKSILTLLQLSPLIAHPSRMHAIVNKMNEVQFMALQSAINVPV